MDKNNVPDNLPTGSPSPLAGATPDLHTNSGNAPASNPQFIGMPTRSALGSAHANSTVPDYSSPAIPTYRPEEISSTSVQSTVIPKPVQPAVTPAPAYVPPVQPKPVASVVPPTVQPSTVSSSTYTTSTSSYGTPSSATSSYGSPTPAYTAAQKAALEAAASVAAANAAAAQPNRANVSSQSHPMKNIWIAIATLVVLLLLGGGVAYYYFMGSTSEPVVPPVSVPVGQNNGSSFPAGVRPATSTPASTNPSGAFSKSNRDLITDYIRANINTLSPKKASPAFTVTSISFDGPDRALVDYANGRVSYTAAAVATVDSAGKVRITSFIILEK